MAYTTPRTWVTGEVVTAAELNANIRDNIAFLANKPTCRVFNSGNESIPDSTQTAITFNSERFKTVTGMHSTSSNTSRLIATSAGKHLMIGHVAFAANVTGRRLAYIRINGTTLAAQVEIPPANGTGDAAVPVSAMWDMAVNDYAELLVYQSSGGALNVVVAADVSPEFSMTWITL